MEDREEGESLRLTALNISQESPQARRARHRALWRKAVFKVKMDRAIKATSDEILIYGTQNELLDQNMLYKTNIDELVELKSKKLEKFRVSKKSRKKCCLLQPESGFRQVWDLVMLVILMYTALVVPFRVAFFSEVFWDGWTVCDFILDGLFLIDVLLTFVSVQVYDDGTRISDRTVIACSYLKSWFWVDLLACIPFSLLDYFASELPVQHSYNTLLRLLRLPRLYKLFRLARILKALKRTAYSSASDRIQEFIQMNSRLWKLIKFLVSVFLCVHIMACFWFFSARIDSFDPDTWVMRYGFVDDGVWSQYLTSTYWTVTTVVTVGYGDISAGTNKEMMLAIAWMVIGVGFYSFTIGSLSSFLTSVDGREAVLSAKLAAIQEFANETSIPDGTRLKVRNAISYNTIKRGTVWSDQNSLFAELPKSLRYEVVTTMYGGIYRLFPFFSKRDAAFTSFVMPRLRPLKQASEEYLYREGDYADEVYFISSGRVNFVLKGSEIAYKSFLRGSYIGEEEVLLKVHRRDNVQCFGETELLVLSQEDFQLTLEEFPSEARDIRHLAKERLKKNRESRQETEQLLALKLQQGSLSSLAGQHRMRTLLEPVEDSEDEESLTVRLSTARASLKCTNDSLSQLTRQTEELQATLSALLTAKGL